MGKSDTQYQKLLSDIKSNVQKANSSRHNQKDLVSVAHTLINSPDEEFEVYVNDVDNPVVTKPVEHYRESLKPVLKEFGVDNAELDRIKDVQFTKDHADALVEVGMQVVKDYTSTGRKLIFPIESKDESQMEIAQRYKDETRKDTKKPVQNPDGTYTTVPTGERKITKAHYEMVAQNKVPGWLSSTEKI